MKKLLKVVFIVNALAGIAILVLSRYVAAFSITTLSDFLFYIVIVVWGIAGLTWEGSKETRNWEVDRAASKATSMVSSHDFKSDLQQQKRHNYQFGLMMFVAGLPALLGCILLHFFF